jgi:hypothetical protein
MSSGERNDMPLWRAVGKMPGGSIVTSGQFRADCRISAECVGAFMLNVRHGAACEFVKVEMLEHGKVREAKGCDLRG